MNSAELKKEKKSLFSSKKQKDEKIRVEFDRTDWKDRWKIRLKTGSFIVNIVWRIFRFILLLGISYVVIFPFISKIFGSFMSPQDLVDVKDYFDSHVNNGHLNEDYTLNEDYDLS